MEFVIAAVALAVAVAPFIAAAVVVVVAVVAVVVIVVVAVVLVVVVQPCLCLEFLLFAFRLSMKGRVLRMVPAGCCKGSVLQCLDAVSCVSGLSQLFCLFHCIVKSWGKLVVILHLLLSASSFYSPCAPRSLCSSFFVLLFCLF